MSETIMGEGIGRGYWSGRGGSGGDDERGSCLSIVLPPGQMLK